MFDWLTNLFKKKVDTSPAIPAFEEPSVKEVVLKKLGEAEQAWRIKAVESDSQALRVKLHAKADALREVREHIASLELEE